MPTELENLEQRLLSSPTARARFLADTLELFEQNGVDVSDDDFRKQIEPALDLTDGNRFLSGLAASSVVIVAATAGQRGAAQQESLSQVASSVVIVAATAGQRGALGAAQAGRLGQAASSVVIVAATAGQRGSLGATQAGRLGQAASSVVIVAASAGQRGSLGATQAGRLGQAASSVVIVAASAGQRGALGAAGGLESAPEASQEAPLPTVTISVPTAVTLAEIAHGLQAISELLLLESAGIDEQVKAVSRERQG
jgi:hypothetical protein